MDRGVAMPFNVNNVDITVAANFMYGVVACVASQVCSLDLIDHDIQVKNGPLFSYVCSNR